MPADSVVGLVIAMALCAAASIPQVWRRLHPRRDHPEPTDSAVAPARRRLGVAPLRHRFHETDWPRATPQTVGVCYRGGRLMGRDGPTRDRPDTPENARPFGRPKTGRAEGAFPQVRRRPRCEWGTHAVCGRALKPIGHGAPSRVGPLLDHLGPGDLLSGDRGVFSSERIRSVIRRGTPLLARVKSHTGRRPRRRRADGSSRAQVDPSETDRPHDTRGIAVRVIADTHDDPPRPGAGERPRRLTDLTNPQDRPAHETPLVSHERGEHERAFDEIKTPLCGRAVPIRSRTPAGVVQEVEGLVLAHYGVRRVMPDAAVLASQDPDRLSFIDSLRVLQGPVPESPAVGTATRYERLLRAVRRQELRPRRDRWDARVIKRKMSNGRKKRPEHRNPPQPMKPFREAVVLLI